MGKKNVSLWLKESNESDYDHVMTISPDLCQVEIFTIVTLNITFQISRLLIE